jgi:hypothetical protein
MSAALKKIRYQAFVRSSNHCECGCGRWVTEESGHLDHFWGRARQESIESCWFLHPECDLNKTLNKPDWASWGRRFLSRVNYLALTTTIGKRELYLEQVKQAEDRIAWVEAYP